MSEKSQSQMNKMANQAQNDYIKSYSQITTDINQITKESLRSELKGRNEAEHQVLDLAKFVRDMRRITELRKQYRRLGLNTFESNELTDLCDKYEIHPYKEELIGE